MSTLNDVSGERSFEFELEENLEKLFKAFDIRLKLLCANEINSMDLKFTANDLQTSSCLS